jgi:hypothetical protein
VLPKSSALRTERHEELRAAGILARVRQRQLPVAGEQSARMKFIVVNESQAAGAIGKRVAALNLEARRHEVKNRVGAVETGRGESLIHIHGVRRDVAEQHEGQITDVRHRRQPAAERRLKCAGRVRRGELHDGQPPEGIVRVDFDRDSCGAAGGGEGERTSVGRAGRDGKDEGFAGRNVRRWNRINHRSRQSSETRGREK